MCACQYPLEKFQRIKKEDKTIVLGSHSMNLVKGFCEKTLYLLNGETRAFGPSEEATNRYLEDLKPSTVPT